MRYNAVDMSQSAAVDTASGMALVGSFTVSHLFYVAAQQGGEEIPAGEATGNNHGKWREMGGRQLTVK